MSIIKQVIMLEDSTRLSLPASVYTVKEYIKGGKPFGTVYIDDKGKWHLCVTGQDPYPLETKGTIVLE